MREDLRIELSDKILDLREAEEWLRSDVDGAVVIFEGNIRKFNQKKEVLYIDFEAYDEMAMKELYLISKEVVEAHDLSKIFIAHRKGRVYPSETAVVVGVSSPHRKNAFVACAEIMDRLKQTVPIWKKEVYTDGQLWVSAHP